MDNSIPTQRPSPMVAAAGRCSEGVRRVVQVVVLPREPPAPQPGLGDGRRHRRKQLRRLAVWAGHGAACRVPAWLAEGPTRVPTCGRRARIGVSSCAGAQLRVPWPKGRRAQVWVAAWRGAASLASVLAWQGWARAKGFLWKGGEGLHSVSSLTLFHQIGRAHV